MPEPKTIPDRQKNGDYFPLKLSVAYIIVTLLLSVVGPIEHYTGAYKKHLSILYVGAVVVFLICGYYFGLHIKNEYPLKFDADAAKKKILWLLNLAQNIAIISIVLEFCDLVASGRFSLDLRDVGTTYINIDRAGSANAIIIFRFCTSFFRTAAVSLGFFFYRESSSFTRHKTVICAVGIFAIYLFGYGTQSGISYIFIELLSAIGANMIRTGAKFDKKIIRRFAVLAVALLFLFAYMQYMRYDFMGVNAYNYHLRSTGEYGYDTDHIIFKIFGDKLGFGLSTILGGYMSLGYYGLSLCLQLPFEWTYGVGHSYALILLLERFGITGILDKTYLLRMESEFGRNGLAAWNSIFPWFASDFAWAGTLVVFFIIGAVLAFAWKDVLDHKNAFSFLVFTTLMLLVFFIPANNAIVHGYDNLLSTMFVFAGWFFLRKNYRYE